MLYNVDYFLLFARVMNIQINMNMKSPSPVSTVTQNECLLMHDAIGLVLPSLYDHQSVKFDFIFTTLYK